MKGMITRNGANHNSILVKKMLLFGCGFSFVFCIFFSPLYLEWNKDWIRKDIYSIYFETYIENSNKQCREYLNQEIIVKILVFQGLTKDCTKSTNHPDQNRYPEVCRKPGYHKK